MRRKGYLHQVRIVFISLGIFFLLGGAFQNCTNSWNTLSNDDFPSAVDSTGSGRGPSSTAPPFSSSSPEMTLESYRMATDGDDSAPALQRLIDAARTQDKDVNLKLDPKIYYFNCANIQDQSCIEVTNLRSLKITGQTGTQIILRNPRVGFLKMSGLQNISLENLKIDYETPPFTQGVITQVNSDSFVLQIDSGFPEISTALCQSASSTADSLGRGFWGMPVVIATKQIKNTSIDGGNLPSRKCVKISDHKYQLWSDSSKVGQLSVGDGFVQLIQDSTVGYTRSLLWFDQTQQAINLKDLTIHASAALATIFTGNLGSIVIQGLQIRFPEQSRRLLVSVADGIHMQHNWASLLIENSYFEGLFDNSIDIGSVPSDIVAVESPTSIIISEAREVRTGDLVQIVSPLNGGYVKNILPVSAVTRLDNGRTRVVFKDPNPADRAILANSDFLFDLSAANPSATIRNNTFMRSRGLGMLNRSPWSTVSGNTFWDMEWAAIRIDHEVRPEWRGGPVGTGIKILGNKIHGGDGGQIIVGSGSDTTTPLTGAIPGPYDIVIDGNEFYDAHGPNIQLYGTSGILLKNNLIKSQPQIGRAKKGGVVIISRSMNTTVDGLWVTDPRSQTVAPLVEQDSLSFGSAVTNFSFSRGP